MNFDKFGTLRLSRAESRALATETPVGDPHGGAAYGERNDPVTAMVSAGAMIGGGTIVGGLLARDAAGDAADAQVASANQADATQRYMFDQSAKMSEPWRSAGVDALDKIRTVLGIGGRKFTMDDMQLDPSYQFRLGEGTKALERSAAARGGLLSGRTGKELTRYGQDYASTEYGNMFNRLASVSGIGQATAQGIGANAMASGTNSANIAMNAGNARASGYVGQANAVTGAMGSGLSFLQSQQMINNFKPRYTMGDAALVQPSVPGQFNLDTYG